MKRTPKHTTKKTNPTKTGMIPEKYWLAMEEGKIPFIPKNVLQRYGWWQEIVEDLFGDGLDDDRIRLSLFEYGCKPAEIDGYFAQYA